jgi:hypothetical protein
VTIETTAAPASGAVPAPTPDDLYRTSMALNRAITDDERLNKLSNEEWLSYFEAQTAVWQGIYDLVLTPAALVPAWAIFAVGTQLDQYRQKADTERRRIERKAL